MASPPTEAPGRLVRFGNFEVDLRGVELRKKGLRIKLQEQPRNILKVLLEHPGELITREELRQRLWQPDTFVDFDHSLNTAMMRLREVLGDSPENPRFIETVPRKGYRFIAPVQQIVQDAAPEPAPPPAASPVPQIAAQTAAQVVASASAPTPVLIPPPGSASASQYPGSPQAPANTEAASPAVAPGASPAVASSATPVVASGASRAPAARQVALSRVVLGGAAAVLLVVLAAALALRGKWSAITGTPPPHISSIMVLPMENLSGDKDQEYFADGMTDELIASLAQISSLRVISRTTAMEYKGTHVPLEKIAHDLGVDAVVEGTVLRSGDRVRITAELIQVSTDRHLWADTYQSGIGDVLTLQNQVATAIVNQIRIKLTPQDKERLAAVHPVNSAAYEDYLKGRYYWGRRSKEDLLKAIDYFQMATEKDPQYALAYAGLADCYGILGAAIVGTVPTSDVAPKAEAAAIKAVGLDPNLAETQTALATVQFNYKWDWSGAESGFKRAIELNPSYATARQRYSLYLMAMGRTSESLDEMNRARSIDPLSLSMNFSLGWRLYMARQYDQAITQLQNTTEMNPAYILAYIVLGQCYEQKQDYANAIAVLQKASTMSHNSPPVVAALGRVYALAGKRAEALRLLAVLQAESRDEYVSPFYMAILYAGLGENKQAMDWLDKAYLDRSNGLVFLKVDPEFDSLRSDPRFQALLQKLGL